MMAADWICVSCLLALPILAVVGVLQWVVWLARRRRFPPGPIPLPLLGNLLCLTSHHPPLVHRALTNLARSYHVPLLFLQLGNIPTIVASTAAAAEQVLLANDISLSSRPYMKPPHIFFYGNDALAAPYGDDWRFIRRLYSRHLFNSVHIQHTHLPIICDETSRILMRDIYTSIGTEINPSALFRTLLHNISCRTITSLGDVPPTPPLLLNFTTISGRLSACLAWATSAILYLLLAFSTICTESIAPSVSFTALLTASWRVFYTNHVKEKLEIRGLYWTFCKKHRIRLSAETKSKAWYWR